MECKSVNKVWERKERVVWCEVDEKCKLEEHMGVHS